MTEPKKPETLGAVALQILKNLESAEHLTKEMLQEILAKDGQSIASTLSLPFYTAPDRCSECEKCTRKTAYFDGCSIVECPQRKRFVCPPREDSFIERYAEE